MIASHNVSTPEVGRNRNPNPLAPTSAGLLLTGLTNDQALKAAVLDKVGILRPLLKDVHIAWGHARHGKANAVARREYDGVQEALHRVLQDGVKAGSRGSSGTPGTGPSLDIDTVLIDCTSAKDIPWMARIDVQQDTACGFYDREVVCRMIGIPVWVEGVMLCAYACEERV